MSLSLSGERGDNAVGTPRVQGCKALCDCDLEASVRQGGLFLQGCDAMRVRRTSAAGCKAKGCGAVGCRVADLQVAGTRCYELEG